MYNRVDSLVKTARETKKKGDENAGVKSVAAGALAASSAGVAKPRVLGYHDVYHGTRSDSAHESIKSKGLKRSKGGTGVSRTDDFISNGGKSNHVERSKGHVYFSKKPLQAKLYTKKGIFGTDISADRVTHAKIPHDTYTKHSVKDSLTSKLLSDTGGKFSEKQRKAQAAKSSKSISPARIVGSSKYKGEKQFATGKNMKKYLSTSSGKARFAKGVAVAGLGAVSAAYSARKGIEALKDSARSKKK